MNDQFGDIEQESEQHRANIADLIDELRSQITPGAIVSEVLGPEGGADLLRYVGYQVRKQVRKNPLPIGVIGIGVAWLLWPMRCGVSTKYRFTMALTTNATGKVPCLRVHGY